jgi:4'-phosphopantetheinyl transferase
MITISRSDFVRCTFGSAQHSVSVPTPVCTEIYYAETGDIECLMSDLERYITENERQRAEKFRFENDRNTYISSHAALRLILSERLDTNPLDIGFTNGKYNKPGIRNDRLFFNLAHTRDAFAIAVSDSCSVGVDLEGINRSFDFDSIIRMNFSPREREFILRSDVGAGERFFLLWTRKEALLKALGTGITDHLTEIEVAYRDNFIDGDLFDKNVTGVDIPDHFIYSGKAGNNYISVAIPCKALIKCHNLNGVTFQPFLLLSSK